MAKTTQYTEDNIRSLDWKEHIRMRPGMYIGKLGDGSAADDGIYVLLKEVIDNCVDEFVMGNGKTIEVLNTDGERRSLSFHPAQAAQRSQSLPGLQSRWIALGFRF